LKFAKYLNFPKTRLSFGISDNLVGFSLFKEHEKMNEKKELDKNLR